jgi:hypothetical protein
MAFGPAPVQREPIRRVPRRSANRSSEQRADNRLNIGLHNLSTFRYLAVMSSGWTTEQAREVLLQNRSGPDSQVQRRAEAVLVGVNLAGISVRADSPAK